MSKNWSKSLRNLLSLLFAKNPKIRLANTQNIKNHSWFGTIDWEKLIQKELKAPFIPKLDNDMDTQNFDREFTQCDIES